MAAFSMPHAQEDGGGWARCYPGTGGAVRRGFAQLLAAQTQGGMTEQQLCSAATASWVHGAQLDHIKTGGEHHSILDLPLVDNEWDSLG